MKTIIDENAKCLDEARLVASGSAGGSRIWALAPEIIAASSEGWLLSWPPALAAFWNKKFAEKAGLIQNKMMICFERHVQVFFVSFHQIDPLSQYGRSLRMPHESLTRRAQSTGRAING